MRDDIHGATNDQWDAWQTGYRFGAFYIFPPLGVIEPIDALRQAHDPKSAAICHAHVNLSEPLPGPMTDRQADEVREALAAVEPFDIRYGLLRDFLPHPGGCYAVAPENRISELRHTLHRTSIFEDQPLTRAHIAPHMTIAEFITVERTSELLDELQGRVPEGSFRCDSVAYAVPDARFHFEPCATFRLGS